MITVAGARAAFKLLRARVLWLKCRPLTNCLKIISVFFKIDYVRIYFCCGISAGFCTVVVAHAHTIFPLRCNSALKHGCCSTQHLYSPECGTGWGSDLPRHSLYFARKAATDERSAVNSANDAGALCVKMPEWSSIVLRTENTCVKLVQM